MLVTTTYTGGCQNAQENLNKEPKVLIQPLESLAHYPTKHQRKTCTFNVVYSTFPTLM